MTGNDSSVLSRQACNKSMVYENCISLLSNVFNKAIVT